MVTIFEKRLWFMDSCKVMVMVMDGLWLWLWVMVMILKRCKFMDGYGLEVDVWLELDAEIQCESYIPLVA